MGSLLNSKTSIVGAVGFFSLLLLALPALAYGDRYVYLTLFQDGNCTEGLNGVPSTYGRSYEDNSTTTRYFRADPSNDSYTFQSAILRNYTGDVLTLDACQTGFICRSRAQTLYIFPGEIGVCHTAGGTTFNAFLLS